MRNLINKKNLVDYIVSNNDAKDIATINTNIIIARYTNPNNLIIAVLDPTKLDTDPLTEKEIQAGFKLIKQAIRQAKRHQIAA